MCDTLVVVEEGRVLFGKNSDRDPNEAQLLEWHTAATHEAGGRVRCTWIDVPQVAETRAVLLSRPFWMWGAEMGANEAGVVIGNEAVFTNEPHADTGLLGMDLLRLGLERAGSASEAVEVMVALLEEHGQGGGCGLEDPGFTYHNSFLVADAARAYVLETAGRKWATEEVASGVRSVSNGLTISGFAERHADEGADRFTDCVARRRLTEEGGADAGGPLDVMDVLRTHEGRRAAPTYHEENGAMAAPCVHAGGTVASSQTTASWVSELGARGARHWATATAAPCTSLFKPVAVGQVLDLGPDPADRFDPQSLWWRHELLHRRVDRDVERLLPLFGEQRDRLEGGWCGEALDPERAWKEAEVFLAEWTQQVAGAAAPDRDVRPDSVQRYWAARNERAGLPIPSAGSAVR